MLRRVVGRRWRGRNFDGESGTEGEIMLGREMERGQIMLGREMKRGRQYRVDRWRYRWGQLLRGEIM